MPLMHLWLLAPMCQIRARPALGHGAAEETSRVAGAPLWRWLRPVSVPVCCAGGAVQACQGTPDVHCLSGAALRVLQAVIQGEEEHGQCHGIMLTRR